MKKIQILGMDCPKCRKLYERAEIAAKELHLEYSIEKITDINRITDMGVSLTPALFVNGTMKISGEVPSVESLKKLLL
jgi:small redox-active disulfide protein 2